MKYNYDGKPLKDHNLERAPIKVHDNWSIGHTIVRNWAILVGVVSLIILIGSVVLWQGSPSPS